jgi:hypothetical protein
VMLVCAGMAVPRAVGVLVFVMVVAAADGTHA